MAWGGGQLLARRGVFSRLSYPLVGLCVISLVFLAGCFIFPVQGSQVYAEETTTKANLSINPTISISLPTSIAVDLVPTASGNFNSSSVSLSVSTNNSTGYALYLSSTNGANTLQSNTNDYEIAAVSNNTTSANFTNNTWGYYLDTTEVSDNTEYSPIPTSATDPLKTTDTATTDTYNLAIGAKVDTSIPPGTYSSELLVSVVANPTIATNWDELTKMQEMTNDICTNAPDGATKQLIDSRDGKSYWVAKLADGNCWMTQSLDYDIPASGLTSADSDVTNAWNSSSTYKPTATSTSIFDSSDYTGTYSWDPGMYVKTNPTDYYGYCAGSSGITSFANSECTSAGWTNVSTMTAMTEENTSGNVILDNTYDAHYLVGNFYQWNAATAGTGGIITSQEATDSICPKGWHLPTSNNTNNGSFYYLLNQYGMASSTNSGQIANSPVYFQYSGYVNSGSLRYAGNRGRYWSSTAYSNTSRAYYLDFDSTSLYPSPYNTRYSGFSVRCLAD